VIDRTSIKSSVFGKKNEKRKGTPHIFPESIFRSSLDTTIVRLGPVAVGYAQVVRSARNKRLQPGGRSGPKTFVMVGRFIFFGEER